MPHKTSNKEEIAVDNVQEYVIVLDHWEAPRFRTREMISFSVRTTERGYSIRQELLGICASGKSFPDAMAELELIIEELIEDIFHTEEPSVPDFGLYRAVWARFIEAK